MGICKYSILSLIQTSGVGDNMRYLVKLKGDVSEDIISDMDADLISALSPSTTYLNEELSSMSGNGWYLKYRSDIKSFDVFTKHKSVLEDLCLVLYNYGINYEVLNA